jgi:fucose 4-O-acetylase-like acetyltransferase
VTDSRILEHERKAVPVTRRADIDCAKGIGILLVVIGHLAAKSQPADNIWYTNLQTGIYAFHMPFFLYLSGYVSFISGAGDAGTRQWGLILRRRAERLLLPFFLFGAALFTGKLIAARFMYVDNPPSLNLESLLNLVWTTDNSPAVSIWYMYVLFWAAVITPVLIWVARGSRLVAVVVSAALFFVGAPHYLFMNWFAEYYLFFMFGALAADAGQAWTAFLDRYRGGILGLFSLSLVARFLIPDFEPHWAHLLCGTLSLAAVHSFVRWGKVANSRLLLSLGGFSFVIYLLNTPAIGLAKGILIKWVPWDGPTFVIHAIVLLACGLLIPVLIKRWIFSRWRYLDRLTNN